MELELEYVLAIDRDANGLQAFATALQSVGLHIRQTTDLDSARDLVGKKLCRAVLIDRNLANISGLQFTKLLRSEPATQNIPIVMVSNRASDLDIVEGLESGVDDFMAKPLRAAELVRRFQAIIRRRAMPEKIDDQVFCVGGLTIDIDRRTVKAGADVVGLTVTEFKLLTSLARSPNRLLSRTQIVNMVWNEDCQHQGRKVDVHVKRLRTALDHFGMGQVIQTVRGEGYYLRHD